MIMHLSPASRKYKLRRIDIDDDENVEASMGGERDTWEEAAQDAVNLGVGRWEDNSHVFKLDEPYQIRAMRAK